MTDPVTRPSTLPAAFAERDYRIRVARGPNGGVAAARNRGFAETDPRSSSLIFLDSDDLWEPDALETLVNALDAHPEYSSTHSVARSIDAEGRQLPGDDLDQRSLSRRGFAEGQVVARARNEPTTFADLAVHNWVLTPGTHLIRRDVMEMVGDFDVATDPADDWDMAIRVSRHGDIGFVDRSLLLWRRHPATLTNTSPRWRRGYTRVRKKMIVDPANTPDQTRTARLGYVFTARSTTAEARELVARKEYRRALRLGAKALHQYLSYVQTHLQSRPMRYGTD